MVGWLAMWPCEERVCFSTFIISSILFFFSFLFYQSSIHNQHIQLSSTVSLSIMKPEYLKHWPKLSLFARNFCLVLCNLFNPLRIEEQLLQPISPKVCSVSFLGLFLSLFGIVFFLFFFLSFFSFRDFIRFQCHWCFCWENVCGSPWFCNSFCLRYTLLNLSSWVAWADMNWQWFEKTTYCGKKFVAL